MTSFLQSLTIRVRNVTRTAWKHQTVYMSNYQVNNICSSFVQIVHFVDICLSKDVLHYLSLKESAASNILDGDNWKIQFRSKCLLKLIYWFSVWCRLYRVAPPKMEQSIQLIFQDFALSPVGFRLFTRPPASVFPHTHIWIFFSISEFFVKRSEPYGKSVLNVNCIVLYCICFWREQQALWVVCNYI